MSRSTIARAMHGVLACLALLASLPAAAGNQLSANVAVKVRLVSSSGTCGAVSRQPDLSVSCRTPPGPLLPVAGAVPLQRVPAAGPTLQPMGVIPAAVVGEPLPIYGDGVKITSWRIVQLDNAKYVELTIAW